MIKANRIYKDRSNSQLVLVLGFLGKTQVVVQRLNAFLSDTHNKILSSNTPASVELEEYTKNEFFDHFADSVHTMYEEIVNREEDFV